VIRALRKKSDDLAQLVRGVAGFIFEGFEYARAQSSRHAVDGCESMNACASALVKARARSR